MKKAKIWFKEHKKEIIVAAAAAAGGTALYFLSKEKKIKGIKAGLRLSFEFLNGKDDADFFTGRLKSGVYTNLNLHKPDFTVGDLGKLGEELMKNIPSLTKDIPIDHLNASYSISKQ